MKLDICWWITWGSTFDRLRINGEARFEPKLEITMDDIEPLLDLVFRVKKKPRKKGDQLKINTEPGPLIGGNVQKGATVIGRRACQTLCRFSKPLSIRLVHFFSQFFARLGSIDEKRKKEGKTLMGILCALSLFFNYRDDMFTSRTIESISSSPYKKKIRTFSRCELF